MEPQDRAVGDDSDRLSDSSTDLQRQNVGYFNRVPAQVTLGRKLIPIVLSGEVIVQGQLEDGHFNVQRWRRLALYGQPDQEQPPARNSRAYQSLGVVSLLGRLDAFNSHPGSHSDLEQVPVWLHYRALSTRLEPRHRDVDAIFPEWETFRANLRWTGQGVAESGAPRLALELKLDQVLDAKLGLVKAIELEPATIELSQFGSETYRAQQHHSLSPNCVPLAGGASPFPTFKRKLPLRLVNLCTRSLAAVEHICQVQLDNVCRIWNNKAALDLEVEAELIDLPATDKNLWRRLTLIREQKIGGVAGTSHQVEVYLIDKFSNNQNDSHGGGIVYRAGTADAYCILQVDLADANTSGRFLLLAHEIGHVLGLSHPTGPNSNLLLGSSQSIMDVSGPAIPPRLTRHECDVLEDQPGALPHNPLVITTAAADFFHPDP